MTSRFRNKGKCEIIYLGNISAQVQCEELGYSLNGLDITSYYKALTNHFCVLLSDFQLILLFLPQHIHIYMLLSSQISKEISSKCLGI